MGKIIVVTSGKGGVGKTTVTAGLGTALSKRNKKVLLADTDFGLRNLDLVLGVESQVVYDVLDCIDERCEFNDAVISFPDNENLYFLPASQSRSGRHIEKDKFISFFRNLSEDFDYIFLDSPAGLGPVIDMDAELCDEAIIVAGTYISSVRDSDRCIDILERNKVKDFHLIINAHREELSKNGVLLEPEYVMDILGIPLLGIVPYDDYQLNRNSEIKDAPSEQAFSNISGRMLGEKIPVNAKEKKKISFSKKLMNLFNKKNNNGGF